MAPAADFDFRSNLNPYVTLPGALNIAA